MARFGLPKIKRWPFFNLFNNRQVENYQYRTERVHQVGTTNYLIANGPQSVMAPIVARLALDCSTIPIRHVMMENEKFKAFIPSDLDFALTTHANIDQSGSQFKIDAITSLLHEGAIAIVPIELDNEDPGGSISDMRVGKIEEWFARDIRVRVYNDRTGQQESVIVPKSYAAVVENPLMSVMNAPNSTLQRLMAKLSALDFVDNQNTSKRLDLVVQLPFAIRNAKRKEMAEERRAAIVDQLSNSDYGVAYIDATEKVIQLNRPVENMLLQQVNDLSNSLYGQLGMPPSVFDGTADEATLVAYYSRSVYPIVNALAEAMKRTFLEREALRKGESIEFFPNLFKMVAPSKLAEMVDPLVRNEVVTGNDMRSVFALPPSDDPKADKLYNPHIRGTAKESVEDDSKDQIEEV